MRPLDGFDQRYFKLLSLEGEKVLGFDSVREAQNWRSYIYQFRASIRDQGTEEQKEAIERLKVKLSGSNLVLSSKPHPLDAI